MEALRASFRFFFRTRPKRSHSSGRLYESGSCRLRFSFFADDLYLCSRAVRCLCSRRSAGARHAPRRAPELVEEVALRSFASGRVSSEPVLLADVPGRSLSGL